MNKQKQQDNQRGLALLMVVFVIALASIIVMEMSYRSRYDQKAARVFAESVQADYMLKSGLNFARVLIELPKQVGATNTVIQEDWLGEPWALIAAAPSLPISGFSGEIRIMIVDNDGKMDLNLLAKDASETSPMGNLYSISPTNQQTGLSDPTSFWKEAFSVLFTRVGFTQEKYDPELHRTPGNIAYESAKQVAIIHDWIDSNSTSHSSPIFDADGIESSADKRFFFNRPFAALSEILLVPGFTLERLSKIAPYAVAGNGAQNGRKRVNINTAPLEVLLAIGFTEMQAMEIVEQRANLPYSQAMLEVLVSGNVQLKYHVKVTSSEFGVYVQVKTPNATKWLRSNVKTIGRTSQRRTSITSAEYY